MMFFGVRFCAVNNMQYFYLLNSACPPKSAFFSCEDLHAGRYETELIIKNEI